MDFFFMGFYATAMFILHYNRTEKLLQQSTIIITLIKQLQDYFVIYI